MIDITMKKDSDKKETDIVEQDSKVLALEDVEDFDLARLDGLFNAEPDEYDIHYHRYTLQFRFIPELIDRVNEDNWDVSVLTDKAWWREQLEEMNADFYFDWDALTMERRKQDNGNVLILYCFPRPLQIPEALYGVVLLDTTTERASYYTLECSLDDSWCVCNPTTEAHRNCGFVDTDGLQCFIDRVMEISVCAGDSF